MTATIVNIRKQLAALLLLARPPNSLAAKLDTLTDEQRAQYDRWHARYEQWFDRCKAQHDDDIEPDARSYANTLDRDTSPRLRSDIAVALFGKVPAILKSDTDDTAAHRWLEIVQS